MHILFAGGGTAGHINPALAAAAYVKQQHPNAKISYIGKKGGMEQRLVAAYGYDFYGIDVAGFQRELTLKNVGRNLTALVKVFTSSGAAKRLLKQLQPDVVVGTGGYVSGPVLRDAAKLGFKTAIHEQNAFPGVTTKMLVGLVDTVMLAMPEAEKRLELKKPPVITGNPVRAEFLTLQKDDCRKRLGLDERPVLLSSGGSLGAAPVNRAVAAFIAEKWQAGDMVFIHATGKAGYTAFLQLLSEKGVDPKAENVRVFDYIDNMAECMVAADMVLSRAGAISLSELCVCKKPAILIPSPYVAENHQYHNAMSLKKIGAAEVIEEKDLNRESLLKAVNSCIYNPQKLNSMAQKAGSAAFPDAAKRIYNEIMKLYTK